jgi:hypothetical protein
MIFYELRSERIPFEDYEGQHAGIHDLVFKGKRPKLPLVMIYLNEGFKLSCWQTLPSKRS